MAKQRGLLRFSGKLGNVVGYKTSLANKSGQSFVRERVIEVGNPKTYGQAVQRCKLKPAQRFYQAFSSVLNHAFLPSQNENRNRARFMKLAMKNPVIPLARKEDTHIAPNVPYQISEGSLGLDYMTVCESRAAGMRTNVKAAAVGEATDMRTLTLGAFSTMILAQNPELENGMELCFLALVGAGNQDGDSESIFPVSFHVVLNSADTLTQMADIVPANIKFFIDDSYLSVAKANSNLLAALGVIISKKTNNSWVYTQSTMYLGTYITSANLTEEAVIESYMKQASTVESDKVLKQADNATANGAVTAASVAQEAYTISTPVQGATYNFASASIATMTDGTKRVVIDGQNNIGVLVDGTWTPITQTVDNVATPVTIDMTAWAGNRTILYTAVNF